MTTPSFRFLCRAKTAFGSRAAQHLPFDLSAMDARKPFVILDNDARRAGYHKGLADAFMDSGMILGFAPVDPDEAYDPDNPDGLERLYQLFTDKGFDCIIALGTGRVVDLAKALNLAVCLGPEILKADAGPERINRPLSPLVYIPTRPGPCGDTAAALEFGGKTFVAPYLMPDLVVISQDFMLVQPEPSGLTDAALESLAVCCEAFALSGNPPARAYAGMGIGLVMENLMPLAADTDNEMPGREQRDRKARLAHASAVAGYIRANCPDLGVSNAPDPAVALVEILGSPPRETPWLADLLLPLTNEETFASTPGTQRPGLAIQTIRNLLNRLFAVTGGRVARTPDDLAAEAPTPQA